MLLVNPLNRPTAADPGVLRRSLHRYGDPPLELRETHGSWVLLDRDHAYKLKKPLQFDFADLRPLEARAQACEQECAANAALARDVVLGVRGVVPVGNGYALADPGRSDVIDHVVFMRRFDERDTLAVRIPEGRAGVSDAVAVGRRIAAFHAGARHLRDAAAPRVVVDRNFAGLVPLARAEVPARRLLAARRFSEAFLLCWEDVLSARAAHGRVIDGHGDLRAEHILLRDGAVTIVDRLEWPAMRAVDVVDDLAFLVMDLETLGAPDLARGVVEGYVEAGGEQPPSELLAFFAAYRALVRAKVALVRAGQAEDGTPHAAQARSLVALARRFAGRARGSQVLMVSGPPASGKSTLATALGEATGLPVLRSDQIRRDLGLDHSPEAKLRVYAELGLRADSRAACIVDATFGEPALRRAFLDALGPDRRRTTLAIQCLAPPDLLLRRAQERSVAPGGDPHGSAATVEVTRRLAQTFSPIDELGPGDRIAVDTQDDPERLVDEVEAWLDGLLADGRLM